MVSAPSRLAASEKLLRVRVLFSKNRLAIVFPASNDSLPERSIQVTQLLAVSSSVVMSAADRLSRSNK